MNVEKRWTRHSSRATPRGFVLYGTESDEQRDQQEFTGIPAGILAGFLARIPAGTRAERSTK